MVEGWRGLNEENAYVVVIRKMEPIDEYT